MAYHTEHESNFTGIESPRTYKISSYILGKFIGGVNMHGAESIPDEPVVFVVSHRSMLDIPAAGVAIYEHTREPARFIAKDELWNKKKYPVPGLTHWLDAVGAIEITREKPSRDQTRAMVEAAQSGVHVVIYGEGTRGDGPEIGEIQPGALYVAAKANRPINLVGIAGTKPFRFGRTQTVFGETLEADYVNELFRDRKSGSLEIVRRGIQAAFDEAHDYLMPTPR